jgi:hypothetical protein
MAAHMVVFLFNQMDGFDGTIFNARAAAALLAAAV